MAQEILNVEIFATGTWRPSHGTVTITDQDLDDLVASYNELGAKPGFIPVLKLGHTDAQKWFGQKNGAPALGFVSKLWREGSKILANFSNVPDAIVDMISKKRYNTVSVEIYPRYEHEGRTLKNVLAAVALLGAELPAVKGLKELAASLFNAEVAFQHADELVTYTQGEPDMTDRSFTQAEHDALTADAVARATAEFETRITALTADVTRLTGERDRASEALRQFTAEAEAREFTAMVDAAIAAGNLVPAQRDMAIAFGNTLNGTVKYGDGEKPAKELFKEFLATFKAGPSTEEKGSGASGTTHASAAQEVDAKSRALAAEKKISYGDAMTEVLKDESLKARYVAGK